MTDTPLIAIQALAKHYGASEPLRIDHFEVTAGDRLALAGLDAAAAEALMHLVTGAVLPDEGDVRIDGRPTRDIDTDTAWLESLDRFGMVTDRAVLFQQLPVVASLALPLSLSIDPMPPEVRAGVEVLADLAGLSAARLEVPAGNLSVAERWHVHLARAIAHKPRLLLLERPLAGGPSAPERRAFAAALRRAADTRGFGWLAVTDDPEFAAASGSRQLTWNGATVREVRRWRWPFSRRARS